MSLAIIDGFFALANGRRVAAAPKPGTVPDNPSRPARMLFIEYDTTIMCTNGQHVPARLRVYSHPTNNPLPDNVVVALKAKMYLPSPPSDDTLLSPDAPILLEGIVCEPFPGDPALDSYEESVPSLLSPYVFVVGTVSSAVEISDGNRTFSVSFAEYVRDSIQFSSVVCVLDGKSPRWKNTPSPVLSSCVAVFGLCESFNRSLRVGAVHLALNCRPQDAHSLATSDSPGAGPPTKKRRFQATVSPLASSPANAQAGPSNAQPGPSHSSPPPAATAPEPESPSPPSKSKRTTKPRAAAKPTRASLRSKQAIALPSEPNTDSNQLLPPPAEDEDMYPDVPPPEAFGVSVPPSLDKGKGKATDSSL
ncbi:hypothetical protein CC1G_00953 [Coprinopsis cinerea okayama7|uniref:Uncharacterized protein n=1 Tax=Coprinopsis cinerea (strain Okayama-7 / 130 / ATCC MYA-4618 / FGSC 9003) TaxID=240176 RepID=A8N978_COPC7|nr:hypothetical protein CC1G_00953 [Coprinopsis cinerea okayama7\|eukprot:XP_001831406.1 hypothetical protein CC1G_00953 [Coprinopsis cinerea okayama7\